METRTAAKKTRTKIWRLIVVPILFAIVAVQVWFVTRQVVFPTVITSSSMEPTIFPGDKVLVWRYHPGPTAPPQRGDIVFFRDPSDVESWMVKRVIGLPGETVVVFGGRVYINGQPLNEPYAQGVSAGMGLWQVPANGVFVMGDNREVSDDSRAFGPIEMSLIGGRIVWRISPLSRFGRVK